MEPKTEFYKNRYGILIKKCCASCIHCLLDNRGRVCDYGEGHTSSGYLCTDWELKPPLEKAGMGGGKVKRHEYSVYLLEMDTLLRQELDRIESVEERKAFLKAAPKREQLIKEWERKHGSRFINM